MSVILIIVAGIITIILGWWLFKRLVIGAGIILVWASEQEFLGVIAYFAAWVFLFPLMLIASIVTGIIQNSDEKEQNREIETRIKVAESNQESMKKNIEAAHNYKDATDYEKKRGY